MEQLTKEHFDKSLVNLSLSIEAMVDRKLEKQTLQLQDYVHQAFEAHQKWTDERFSEKIAAYDVKEKIR